MPAIQIIIGANFNDLVSTGMLITLYEHDA